MDVSGSVAPGHRRYCDCSRRWLSHHIYINYVYGLALTVMNRVTQFCSFFVSFSGHMWISRYIAFL